MITTKDIFHTLRSTDSKNLNKMSKITICFILNILFWVSRVEAQNNTLILCQYKLGDGSVAIEEYISRTYALIVENDSNNVYKAKYVQYKIDCPDYIIDISNIPSITPQMTEKNKKIVEKSNNGDWLTEEELNFSNFLQKKVQEYRYEKFFSEKKNYYNTIAPEWVLSNNEVLLIKKCHKKIDSTYQQNDSPARIFKGLLSKGTYYVEEGHPENLLFTNLAYNLGLDMYEFFTNYNYTINDSTIFFFDGLQLDLNTMKSLHISPKDIAMSFNEFGQNTIHLSTNLHLLLNNQKIKDRDKNKTLSALTQAEIKLIRIETIGKKRFLTIETNTKKLI